VLDDADLDLALRAVLFGAVGTAGQRCTTTRRLFLHKGIAARFTERLVAAYKQVRIGDPLEETTLMGPLIDGSAVEDMMRALDRVRREGGTILCGGGRVDRPGFYVEPTLVKAPIGLPVAPTRLRADPVRLRGRDLAQAIALQNDVPQGLSSAIFTDSLRSAETFLAHTGSDCGIANVNIGTSGRRSAARSAARRRPAADASRLGFLEGLHAAPDQHDQLEQGPSAGQGVAFEI
jgi:aldehyde dehydrogenase (NAD+)